MLILRHFCQHLKVAVTLGFSQRLRHYLVTVIEVCWPKARALVGFDNGVLQSLGSTATVRPGPTPTVEHSEHSEHSGCFAEDLGSSNGSISEFLERLPVSAGAWCVWCAGEHFKFLNIGFFNFLPKKYSRSHLPTSPFAGSNDA